ncbi:MAG: RND family transporter [Candidatus Binatia bacterium]
MVRYRIAVLVAVLGLSAVLATQLGNLHLDIRRRANLPDDHPYVQIQHRISDLFGGESIVIIGVIAKRGDVYEPAMLGKVQRITDRLRASPSVIEPSLFSLTAPAVRAAELDSAGVLHIEPLVPEGPPDGRMATRLRERLRDDARLRENLVSADGSATVIVVDFDDRIKDADLTAFVEHAVAPERDDSVVIALAGAPILRRELARYTAMMTLLFPVAVLIIGLVHYQAFRTVQGMFLPLATALLSVIWPLGIMALLDVPIDTWSVLTPVLILAIAAGHAVQILKRYYEEYARIRDGTEAVVRSLVAVGPVMLTAGLIAAAGFASLTTFGITSVRAFGLLLACGIVSALIIEMTFTPACRSLLPPRRPELLGEARAGWLDRGLEAVGRVAIGHPRRVLGVAVVGALGAGLGMVALRVDNSFRFWFSPTSQVRIDDALLNARLPGTATLRILIEGERDGVLLEPAVLRAMSDLQAEMRREPHLGGVSSIADHVRRVHRAMHGGDAAYDTIPDDRRLVGEYVFLYEAAAGVDGLGAFIDSQHRNAVIRALSKSDSAAFSHALLRRLQEYAAERFAGLPVRVGIAGGTLGVQTALNDVVVREKAINVVQVAAIIFVLCAIVLRSVVGALLVLVPLALSVVVNLGLMGWAGIWLDMSTAAMTAMGVSLGADFAIYLLFRVREELGAESSLEAALATSLRTSGKAICYVSTAVVVGYLTLCFSGFSVWVRLATLTSLTVALSAAATCIILPALLVLARPTFLTRRLGQPAMEARWRYARGRAPAT